MSKLGEKLINAAKEARHSINDYVSDRVFEGKRPISEADRKRLIERYLKQRESE